MSDALSGIGNFFATNAPKVGGFLKSNLGSIIPGALTGFGFLNNLIGQNRYNRQEDLAYNLAKNPQAASRYFQGFERPLTAGLTQGVENQVQAALGERGLTLSPAISAAAFAQALAPFVQNQQQLAAQIGMGTLGAGTSFPQARSTDVSGPLAMLMKRFQSPTDPTSQDPNIGAPTLPIPGLDYNQPDWSAGAALPSTGFNPGYDVWTNTIGGFSPATASQLFTPDLLDLSSGSAFGGR